MFEANLKPRLLRSTSCLKFRVLDSLCYPVYSSSYLSSYKVCRSAWLILPPASYCQTRFTGILDSVHLRDARRPIFASGRWSRYSTKLRLLELSSSVSWMLSLSRLNNYVAWLAFGRWEYSCVGWGEFFVEWMISFFILSFGPSVSILYLSSYPLVAIWWSASRPSLLGIADLWTY